jgi:RimJ/RimL family protein N-acetyltransferase
MPQPPRRSPRARFRRVGFRQEAHLVENIWFKGQWGSEYLFAMLQREWRGATLRLC